MMDESTSRSNKDFFLEWKKKFSDFSPLHRKRKLDVRSGDIVAVSSTLNDVSYCNDGNEFLCERSKPPSRQSTAFSAAALI